MAKKNRNRNRRRAGKAGSVFRRLEEVNETYDGSWGAAVHWCFIPVRVGTGHSSYTVEELLDNLVTSSNAAEGFMQHYLELKKWSIDVTVKDLIRDDLCHVAAQLFLVGAEYASCSAHFGAGVKTSNSANPDPTAVLLANFATVQQVVPLTMFRVLKPRSVSEYYDGAAHSFRLFEYRLQSTVTIHPEFLKTGFRSISAEDAATDYRIHHYPVLCLYRSKASIGLASSVNVADRQTWNFADRSNTSVRGILGVGV